MQSMPGMLSKLESDFQERAKAIDTLLEQLRVGSRLLGKDGKSDVWSTENTCGCVSKG